jgi:transcriptional regulator with XRE-family HTH domain
MQDQVDVHVGKRLRQRRWMLGVSQQDAACQIGIQCQQLQEYETGKNRISASRLWAIAKALDIPISYFFEGLTPQPDGKHDSLVDFSNNNELLILVRAYYAIPERHRGTLFTLANALSDAWPNHERKNSHAGPAYLNGSWWVGTLESKPE